MRVRVRERERERERCALCWWSEWSGTPLMNPREGGEREREKVREREREREGEMCSLLVE